MWGQYFIYPLIAALIAQISKFFVKSNRTKFNLRGIVAYSGMPSGHAATTSSLATIIGLNHGVNSAVFGVALILMFIIIRDAMGLRQHLGRQGEIINDLVADLDEDEFLDEKYPKLLERIGHSFVQVLVGSIIGAVVSYAGYLIHRG